MTCTGHVPHDWTGRLSTVALSFCAAANLIVLAFLAARTEDFSCFTRLQLRPDTPRPNGAGVAVAAPAVTTVPSPLNFESLARLDLKQAASGIRASDWCRESCRATFRCEQHEVKLCYWHEHMENATCTCRDELFFPSEWFRGALKSTKVNAQSGPKLHGFGNDAGMAILMTGQVRSFTTQLMQAYWRRFLPQLQREAGQVTLFGVLSLKSTNKQGGNRQPHGEARFFQTKELEELLQSFQVPYRAVFPEDCNWTTTASLVKDPALKFLVSPPDHLQSIAAEGHVNMYRSRVVAFDMMLQFEQEFQKRFAYVLFLRPDMVYSFSLQTISTCPDAVMCFNDMFAAMHRRLAGWYATHIAGTRAVIGPGFKLGSMFKPGSVYNYTKITEEMEDLLGWHLHNGWIHQPMLHLARHGIPFFGLRLDLAEKDAITCGQTTFDWFTIRDLDPTGTALERKICSVRQKVKDLQGFLQKLGVSGNLSSNLEVCPNKT